jgi:copper chaperone CopZ
MQKKTIPLRGMHCRSCEITLTRVLQSIPGITHADVSATKHRATITYDGVFPESEIAFSVHGAGYEVGSASIVPLVSRDSRTYTELLLAAAIGGALFLWLSLFGVFNLSFAFPERPPLSVVVLIGLAAGISTCMALIGGLVLGISSRFAEMHPEASGRARFQQPRRPSGFCRNHSARQSGRADWVYAGRAARPGAFGPERRRVGRAKNRHSDRSAAHTVTPAACV